MIVQKEKLLVFLDDVLGDARSLFCNKGDYFS